MNPIENYISHLHATLDALAEETIQAVIELLHETRMSQQQIFIMGNGGSAATASHMVCDFMKNTRQPGLPNMRVIGLADNMPVFSALANDEGYENVFSGQLESFVQPGDVVIAISGSGNSANVLKAVELANQRGARTVGITGFKGGKLGKLVEFHINVPSDSIEHVEDVHMVLDHVITNNLRQAAMQELSPNIAMRGDEV